MRPILKVFFLASILLISSCNRDPKAQRDRYFKNAQKYLSDGKFEEATIEYRNALQADRNHIPSYLGLAQAFQKMGDHQNAIGVYQQVAKLDAKNVEARLELARYLLPAAARNAELFNNARDMAQEVLTLDPSNNDARILLGNAYSGLGDLDRAVKELEAAAAQDPQKLQATLSLAAAVLRRNETARAEQLLKSALEKHPDSVEAHLTAGIFYGSNRRPAEAEVELRKAFDLAPADPRALGALGSYLAATSRGAEVENLFKDAISRKPKEREPRMALASFYLQQGLTDKAADTLLELLKAIPGDRAAQLRLAEVYVNSKNDAKAEELLRSVLARNRNDPEAHYLTGRILRRRSEPDKAMTEFETAIKFNASLVPAYLEKANLLLTRGDIEGAQKTLGEALERDRANPVTRGFYAKVLALRQKSEDALLEADKALAAMPANADAVEARGVALFHLGRLEESEKAFLRLTELQPQYAAGWHRLGLAAAARNNSNFALTSMRKALELKPDLVAAISDILFVHLRSKQYEAALAELDRISRTPAPKDEVHRLRGQVYLAKGDQSSAEGEFRKAIESNPRNYQVYVLLARLNASRNNIPQAIREVEQLIAKNDKYAPAYFMKGTYLLLTKDLPGSISSLRRARELEPDSPYVANNLAWALAESNVNLDEALSLARDARKKLPEDPEVADTLGWVYYKSKNYTLAVDQLLFSVSNRRQPAAEHYFRLGLAFHGKGDQQLARENMRKALTLSSSFPGADEARRIAESRN